MEPTPLSPEADAGDDRLDSWKEIAAFLRRGVTTVQRWEVEEGLPVRRHEHAKRGTVYAFKSDLTRWRDGRSKLPASSPSEAEAEVAPGSPTEGLDKLAAPSGVPAPAGLEDLETRGIERRSTGWYKQWGSLALPAAAAVVAAVGMAAFGIRGDTPIPVTAESTAVVARPVANDAATEAYPTLSPDGAFVAYRWSRPEAPGIYIKSASGGPARALAIDGPPSTTRRDTFPKWAPDGRSIAFLRELGSSVWDLRVVATDGGTSRHVTQITSGSVSWMPDSETLAVADRPASGEPYSIFLVSTQSGRRIRRVTSPPTGTLGDWHCAVSPDGTRLAVARFTSGYAADIYVMSVDAGEASAARVTNDAVGLGHLEWTPDGSTLVFASFRADRTAVWSISAAPAPDEQPRLVAGAEGGAQHPTLARQFQGDSLRLAFQHGASSAALWRWDLGSVPRPQPVTVAATDAAADRQPAWSPDGSRIAFSSNRSGSSELWVVDASGANPHQVSFQNGGVFQPRWSPDGQRILFTSTRNGQEDISIIRADGTEPVRLTFDPSDERNGSWSRDGRWVYFRSNRGGAVRVWKTRADGRREPVPATQAESSEALESLDGRTLYFTKHDEAGIWQKPLPDGPETLLVGDWHAREGFWDVIREGIVMVDKQVSGSRINQPVGLFKFASNTLESFATLPVIVSRMQDGISARPDGALLWAQSEPRYSDVMLFDRWRPEIRNEP